MKKDFLLKEQQHFLRVLGVLLLITDTADPTGTSGTENSQDSSRSNYLPVQPPFAS
jgi:hypothetical protein